MTINLEKGFVSELDNMFALWSSYGEMALAYNPDNGVIKTNPSDLGKEVYFRDFTADVRVFDMARAAELFE